MDKMKKEGAFIPGLKYAQNNERGSGNEKRKDKTWKSYFLPGRAYIIRRETRKLQSLPQVCSTWKRLNSLLLSG